MTEEADFNPIETAPVGKIITVIYDNGHEAAGLQLGPGEWAFVSVFRELDQNHKKVGWKHKE